MKGLFDFLRRRGRPGRPTRDVAALVEPLRQPALHLVATDRKTDTYLRGTAPLPPGHAWPTRKGRPLAFLAALGLDELAAALRHPWLPDSGQLLFFYDVDEQPWGFDPQDGDAWQVIHVAAGASAAADPGTRKTERSPKFLAPRWIATYPGGERAAVEALDLNEAEFDMLCEMDIALHANEPIHQVGGYPSPVQGDNMELECQLASHGVYCGNGYDDPRAGALRQGAADWRLLLQLDSDDGVDFVWGDVGVLYFWIREADARAKRFDRAWLVLQCT